MTNFLRDGISTDKIKKVEKLTIIKDIYFLGFQKRKKETRSLLIERIIVYKNHLKIFRIDGYILPVPPQLT
jgi:hypothetical protein